MRDPLNLTRDGLLLFATRSIRMFAYGLVSVILLLDLEAVGLKADERGMLISLTLLGDTLITLWLTIRADRFGRRATLIVGSMLMLAAGLVFSMSSSFLMLLIAATIGVISPSGTEVGPFLSVEQAALTEIVTPARTTTVFSWYHVVGICSTALGVKCATELTALALNRGWEGASCYRPALWLYAFCGLLIAMLVALMHRTVEATPSELERPQTHWGLHKSKGVIARLSLLFAMDAFGGGFILQSILAYWFVIRFDVDIEQLGTIFLTANILSGLSALVAGPLAKRFGLINTMVFTHLPSNILLMILPFMPNVEWAVVVLLIRFSISQMDVPTRQAYTMAVVAPDERSAAAGVTSVARSIGASASPVMATMLMDRPGWEAAPLLLAGGIKILYDVALFVMFSSSRGKMKL
jgi:MFS family permease